MLQVISLPGNAVCERWSPMGGMDTKHQQCHALLSVGFLGGTVTHLVLPQVAQKKLHLISLLLFPKWKAGERLPWGLLLPFLWKAGNCTRFGNEPTPTHCNLAAKFRPFLSQAEQAGLAAPHPWLQDCASALFHTQQSQQPSLSISHSDVAPQFLLELFFFLFIHPEVKNP